jgi:acyl carrier protein
MRAQTVELIVNTLDELKSDLGVPELEVGEQTVLFGPTSALDSMGLVTFLLEIEHRAEEGLGLPVRLMDERAMSQNHSPFRTVETLAEYIYTLAEEQKLNV